MTETRPGIISCSEATVTSQDDFTIFGSDDLNSEILLDRLADFLPIWRRRKHLAHAIFKTSNIANLRDKNPTASKVDHLAVVADIRHNNWLAHGHCF